MPTPHAVVLIHLLAAVWLNREISPAGTRGVCGLYAKFSWCRGRVG